MPRKVTKTPTNWRAAEHITALAGIVTTMQEQLLSGQPVGQHQSDFLSQVVELAIALKWEHDLIGDLNSALGEKPHTQTTKTTIVESRGGPATGFFRR